MLRIFSILLLLGTSQAVTAETAHSEVAQDTAVYSAMSMGTGWVISNRHIFTNYHIVANTSNLRLVKKNGTEIPVKIVVTDKNNNIAILSVDSETQLNNPLPLAVIKPKLGASVFTIGFPHPNLLGTNPKLTSGYVSALSGLADDPRTYQVSVPIQSGNSGGPLINMRGEVVGIITSKLNAKKMFEWTGDIPQNVNYAVKINRLNKLVAQLKPAIQPESGGAPQDQKLEVLAESILDSVVIVAGDSNKKASRAPTPSSLSYSQQHEPAQHIVVFSYSEPGVYDIEEQMTGSDTVPVFSKSTSLTLKRKLQHEFGKEVSVSTYAGDDYEDMYVQLETTRIGDELCKRYNARKLVASNSEINSGVHFRYVSYRIFDCNSLQEYSKMFVIERNERHDQYGYENGFISSFKLFIDQTQLFTAGLNG